VQGPRLLCQTLSGAVHTHPPHRPPPSPPDPPPHPPPPAPTPPRATIVDLFHRRVAMAAQSPVLLEPVVARERSAALPFRLARCARRVRDTRRDAPVYMIPTTSHMASRTASPAGQRKCIPFPPIEINADPSSLQY